MNKALRLPALLCITATTALADGPKDNAADSVRPVPPLGVEVPAADKAALTAALQKLRATIDEAAKAQAKNPKLADLLPDVEVYYKATDWALKYNELFNLKDIKTALDQLKEGQQRAEQLKAGETPWTKQTGLVVRGYRSKIDGSVQPYGMVVPENGFDGPKRLDIWCHGRFENTTELGFIQQRRATPGSISPANTLVLHPFGRFSCANKFAGEIDAFEALEHAKKFYPVDNNRVLIRGFSMGGAAAWHLATHYADQWCGANPGAGFSETPEFLRLGQKEDVDNAPWYQKKLWHWYNATDSALNLWHCPTVAYSGELDRQKQAADEMDKALRAEQIDLTHIIGEQKSKGITVDKAHRIMPDALAEVERRLATIAEAGRSRCPDTVHLATWTLRYNRMCWVIVDAMEQEWERCRVHAHVTGESSVEVKTQNTTGLTLDMPSGYCKLSLLQKVKLSIDGQELQVSRPRTDRSWLVHLSRQQGKWVEVLAGENKGELLKRHELQGPIDDAFMSSFVFVKPTGQAWNEAGGNWAKAELDRAVFEWRRQFRGDAPAKDDKAITEADIASSNLVLWGDPASNSLLARIIDKLPLKWSKDSLTLNGKTYAGAGAMPVLIYPNPLNPNKYVVINSSFTYREFDYLNNARQVAKLPDWAAIDITKPKTTQAPGGIADAGFFDEKWQWKAAPVEKK